MSEYTSGDVVDITIRGARVVEVCRHGDGNGDDLRFTYVAKDGEAWPSAVWANAPGVTVERTAAQPGDVFVDVDGDLWHAVSGDRVQHVSGSVIGLSTPYTEARTEFGLTLVSRVRNAA